MPVRKFRRVEDMEAVWYAPGDPALFRAMATIWSFGTRTTQMHYPPGVYKHRTIEEMNQLNEIWDQENFQAFQRRRAAGPGHPG